MVGDGATNYGLQLAAHVLADKYSSRTSLEKAKLSKANLADLIFSLATVIDYGGAGQLVLAAASISNASPAKGGGLERALRALKEGNVFDIAKEVRAKVCGTSEMPGDAIPQDCGDHTGASVTAGDCPSASVATTPSNSAATTLVGDGGLGVSVDVPAANDTQTSQHGVGSQETKKPKLCKTVWKGVPCSSNTCEYFHPRFCSSSACTPTRRLDCPDWHPRKKGERKNLGNGNRGTRQPDRSKAALGNSKRTGPNKRLSDEIKMLHLKLKVAQLEAQSLRAKNRPVSYRDALISQVPAHQKKTQKTQPITPPHPAPDLSQPARLLSPPGSISVPSGNVLPENLANLLTTAIAQALATAGLSSRN